MYTCILNVFHNCFLFLRTFNFRREAAQSIQAPERVNGSSNI